jgi:hypothetical protein
MAKKKPTKKPSKAKPKAAAKKADAKKRDASAPLPPKIEKFQRPLRVELEDEEIAEAALAAAEKLALRDNTADQLKAYNEHEKAKIKDLEAEFRRLSGMVRERAQNRPVVCERRFDYVTKTVTDTRTDTGETLNVRPMTDSELQTDLPFKDIDDEFDDAPSPGDGIGEPLPPDEETDDEDAPESKSGEDDDKPEAAE